MTTVRKTSGRPRTFDREAAIGKATLLFWQRGYETTSMAELTEAMGIHPPSLYSAFGDKESLFLEIVDRYIANADQWFDGIFAREPNVRAAVVAVLAESAHNLTDPDHPPGCLLACGATNVTDSGSKVQASLASRRQFRQDYFVEHLRQAARRGELPANLRPETFATFLNAVIQGMSSLARDGASKEVLLTIAATAMGGWPE